jgi:DNA-binding transcriptional ArsR family regulator
MSNSTAIELPQIDDLLHEPARLRLLLLLSVVKRTDFTYLLKLSGMSKGNLSVQMNKLADAKIVTIDKSFQGNRPRTMYELTAQGRKALRAYKKNMKTILAALPD